MTTTIVIAPVHKSIRVNADQVHAFEVFTSGLSRWWPRDKGIVKMPMKAAVMETRLGGRWYELSEDGTQTNVGKIVVWEPPQRFVMTWDINSQWEPDSTVSSELRSSSLRKARMPHASNWSIASSSGWALSPARKCVRTSMVAGRDCWSASRARPRHDDPQPLHNAAPFIDKRRRS
jgi:uncharacterized protein YndB with AHSA1/START domain